MVVGFDAAGVATGAGSGAGTLEGVASGGVTASIVSGGAVCRFTETGLGIEPEASGRDVG